MRITITGSRNWTDEQLLIQTLERYTITELIHGGAIGADLMAANWARERSIKVTERKPDYDTHKATATHVRNTEMVQMADGVIAFWDGESKGTASTIEKAQKAGKLLQVVMPDGPSEAQLNLWE
ncbi:DUF2493 domain-containing protein [Cytophagaceae bacterium YF14B1]|uniref:DUF2493 domain-containing protein n=1 Tax=Xanthocytophaga flava TaxID=3048013 RepID=A0AAE3QT27_9BACT|nr:DUF2493 domain-containing protein [Xanthocytophaga flavus]MDJ1484927.1 DUF2493 domain-containing protein [Xanthocytophaga flavus]